MVLQAAAYHVAAEGNHVGRTHSLLRSTPGLLQIHQAGNNKAAFLEKVRHQEKTNYVACHSISPYRCRADVHLHGAPTHTTHHDWVPTHALSFHLRETRLKAEKDLNVIWMWSQDR